MKIIGIAGKAGSGKDTAADFICKKYPFMSISPADPIKQGLNAMFGFTNQQWQDRQWRETVIPHINASPRFLAQTLGTEWGRDTVNQNLWVILLDHTIAQLANSLTFVDGFYEPQPIMGVVIPSIRFDNEAQYIWARGGHVMYINRDVDGIGDHASEKSLNQMVFDYVDIDNNGSKEQLYRQMNKFMEGVI